MDSKYATNVLLLILIGLTIKFNMDKLKENMIALNDDVTVTGRMTVSSPIMVRKIVFTNQMYWYLTDSSNNNLGAWTIHPKCSRYITISRVFAIDLDGNEVCHSNPAHSAVWACNSPVTAEATWAVDRVFCREADLDGNSAHGGNNPTASRLEIDLGAEKALSSVWALGRHNANAISNEGYDNPSVWARNNHIIMVCLNNANKIVWWTNTERWDTSYSMKRFRIQV